MALWSNATFAAVYKERYQLPIANYLAKRSKFIAWFKSETNHGADPWKIVYRTNAVRGGTTITTALANRNAAAYDEANPTYAEEHVVVSVSMLAARKTANNANAMVKAVEQAVEACNEEFTLTLETKLSGNGGGARGAIGVLPGGAVVTLNDISTAYRFSRGMRVEACVTDGTVAGVLRLGVGEILSIDPSTGNITLTAAVPGTWVVADSLFREGDHDNAAQRIIQGMQAWVGVAAAGAAPFFGLVRTNHLGALNGTRVAAGSTHILDVIRESCAVNRNNRGECDTWWLNPLKMASVDQAIGARQEFTLKTDYPGIGIKGLRVSTPSGVVSVFESSVFAEDESMLTSRDSWLLGSVGGCPHDVDDDGQLWHLEALEDAIQLRRRAYAQLGNTRPQDTTNITL